MPSNIKQIAIGAAICYGLYKYVSNPLVKSAAIGVLGLIVAKQVPFVKDAVA